MRNYLPRIQEDEILYSFAARYAHDTGLSTAAVNKALFGVGGLRAIDLYAHLDVFASRLPPELGLTAEHIEQDHTLLPYFLAGLGPREKAQRTDALRAGRTAVVRGLAARKITAPTHLRFCPICFRDDMNRNGESYWRRTHQIACVLICPTHGEVLRNAVPRAALRTYHVACARHCPADAAEVLPGLTAEQKSDLLILAKQAQTILLGGKAAVDDAGWLGSFVAKCRARGLLHSHGQINSAAISELIEGRFGYLKAVWPDLLSRQRWIIHAHGRSGLRASSLNPVAALLAELAIDQLPAIESFPHFGIGPWPCRNPLCADYGLDKIKTVAVEFDRANQYQRGIFECHCGYAYSRTERGALDGPARTKTYGPLLAEYVRWAEANGYSYRAALKGISITTPVFNRAIEEVGLDSWRQRHQPTRNRSDPAQAFRESRHHDSQSRTDE